jgi:DNA-binding transcriptional ArsR family regulator
MRAGGQALTLAADPVNREILLACSNRVLEMGGRHYTIANDGREALFVAGTIERWLRQAPDGPIEYGTAAAKRAVAELVEAWSSTLVHTLAGEPMTGAELEAAIDELSRRQLRHRLRAMRGIGMVEALGDGEDALYEMTDWLRLGIAPLIAAARLERDKEMDDTTPVDGLDVVAGFRMALGVSELPEELSGVCRLRLNLDAERDDRLSGVTARIERGAVVSCEARIDEPADAWALSTLDGWLDTVIDLDAKAVRTGGDGWLTGAVVAAIHKALFAPE